MQLLKQNISSYKSNRLPRRPERVSIFGDSVGVTVKLAHLFIS